MPRHAGQMRQVLATFIRPRPMQGRHVSWGGGLRANRCARAVLSSMCFIWGVLLQHVVVFTLARPRPLYGNGQADVHSFRGRPGEGFSHGGRVSCSA